MFLTRFDYADHTHTVDYNITSELLGMGIVHCFEQKPTRFLLEEKTMTSLFQLLKKKKKKKKKKIVPLKNSSELHMIQRIMCCAIPMPESYLFLISGAGIMMANKQ